MEPTIGDAISVSDKLPVCGPYTAEAARRVVNTYAVWCVETTPAEILAAFRIEDESRVGFWDALIIASAANCGAARILSEDLTAGQNIAGITIENPFAQARLLIISGGRPVRTELIKRSWEKSFDQIRIGARPAWISDYRH